MKDNRTIIVSVNADDEQTDEELEGALLPDTEEGESGEGDGEGFELYEEEEEE